MKTRQIHSEDFDGLYKLWEKAKLKLYPIEEERVRFKAMLSLNPELCFVLIDEKQILIGSILGGFDGRTASIHRLAIDPAFQKQGHGLFLLKELEKRLKDKRIKKVSAQIHISNTQVIDFYKKCGYENMDYVINLFKDLK